MLVKALDTCWSFQRNLHRELTAKMLCLYFATMLLGGKIFEVACPSVLGWCWESTLPVLISYYGPGLC